MDYVSLLSEKFNIKVVTLHTLNASHLWGAFSLIVNEMETADSHTLYCVTTDAQSINCPDFNCEIFADEYAAIAEFNSILTELIDGQESHQDIDSNPLYIYVSDMEQWVEEFAEDYLSDLM